MASPDGPNHRTTFSPPRRHEVNRQAALPRRPLTIGELLDAALQLARGRAALLLLPAAVFAIAEQAVLYPVREALGVDLINGFDNGFWGSVGELWLVVAFGFGLEAFIITNLGPWAGRIAAADLTGDPKTAKPPGIAQMLGASLGGVVAAVCVCLGALVGPVWILGYAFVGVAGAVIGLERRGPFGALSRAASLAFRGGMRVTWARSLGYLAWLLLRLGFLLGVLSLFQYFSVDNVGAFWILTVGLAIANTVAYTYLAALDAAAVVESRFRIEGLDIWLSRAERHGPLTPDSLVSR